MSRQQDAYLRSRADGATMMTACADSGLPVEEARLLEKDIARGEITLPAPTTPAAGIAATTKEGPMARKTKPGDSERGTNISETKSIIRDAVPTIINLKVKRKEINAQIAEQRERVKAAGVPKAALDLAIRMKEMDQEDREAIDEGYAIARDALGMGLQRSLFEQLEDPAEERPEALDASRAHLGMADITADAAA